MTLFPHDLRRPFVAFHDWLFKPISAVPFGLLRIGWAVAGFLTMFPQASRVWLFYSDQGVFPPEWAANYSRTLYRFTLLTYVHDVWAVQALYMLLMLALVCMAVGYRTRLATILSVVLMTSFQEHSYAVFAGGDSVLRIIGFILMIAPGIGALSLDRLLKQERVWIDEKRTLPRLQMPAWPRLLLTWQMILIYATAGWYKLLDPMWRNGSGTVASMSHVEFARFGKPVRDVVAYFSVPLSWGTIGWQISWLIFLVPLSLRRRLPSWLRHYRLYMLAIGVIFHLIILILMDAGIFSIAMLAVYLGIADQDDYDALAAGINRLGKWRGRIAVLYDGHCSFCRRTVLPLLLGDWLQRLELVDFHDQASRLRAAPDIAMADLDRALHVRFPDGRTGAGFDGIRMLAWHVPWLWLTLPFLYLPGAALIGRLCYRKVAENRHCLIGNHGKC